MREYTDYYEINLYNKALKAFKVGQPRPRLVIRCAYLIGTKLQSTNCNFANMRFAYLVGTELRGAKMRFADLYKADLRFAKLQGADLRGAVMNFADLQGADIGNAKFDERTVLPDGTKWTPEVDMAKFTN